MVKEENKGHIVNAYNALMATVVVILLSFQIAQTTNIFNIVNDKIDKQDEKIANVNDKIATLQQDVAVIKAFYMKDRSCDDSKSKPINNMELSAIMPDKLKIKSN